MPGVRDLFCFFGVISFAVIPPIFEVFFCVFTHFGAARQLCDEIAGAYLLLLLLHWLGRDFVLYSSAGLALNAPQAYHTPRTVLHTSYECPEIQRMYLQYLYCMIVLVRNTPPEEYCGMT